LKIDWKTEREEEVKYKAWVLVTAVEQIVIEEVQQ
jgi:hypothetical protein